MSRTTELLRQIANELAAQDGVSVITATADEIRSLRQRQPLRALSYPGTRRQPPPPRAAPVAPPTAEQQKVYSDIHRYMSERK
jgi:hypothetical protein